jgi:hypothetical protein
MIWRDQDGGTEPSLGNFTIRAVRILEAAVDIKHLLKRHKIKAASKLANISTEIKNNALQMATGLKWADHLENRKTWGRRKRPVSYVD